MDGGISGPGGLTVYQIKLGRLGLAQQLSTPWTEIYQGRMSAKGDSRSVGLSPQH
jgi:hypothetical protein